MVRVSKEELVNYNNFDYDFFTLPDLGDSAIVRFMYATVDEVFIADSVHMVELSSKTGKKYGKMVDCLRLHNEPYDKCPLCKVAFKEKVMAYLKPVQKAILLMYIESKKVSKKEQAVNRPAIWVKNNKYLDILELEFSRVTDPMVSNKFEVIRMGAKGDTSTTYRINMLEKDNVTLEDLPEPTERGKIILEKTAEDLEYFLSTGKFKEVEKEEETRQPSRQIPADTEKFPSRKAYQSEDVPF